MVAYFYLYRSEELFEAAVSQSIFSTVTISGNFELLNI